MKQAEHCGAFSKPTVEPDRAVERRLLIDEQVLQLVAERLQLVFAGEVLLRARPLGDRVDDAADQLLDAALALGRADLPAEVLRDDDVGRLLRPELRDLDVALLEDDLALLVADDGRADLPFDLVERIDTFPGEEPGVLKPGDVAGSRHGSRSTGGPGCRVSCRSTPPRATAAPLCIIPSDQCEADTYAPGRPRKNNCELERRQTGDVRRRLGNPAGPSVGWRTNMDPVYSCCQGWIH